MYAILNEKGISREDLIATAMELFVPHPGIETQEIAEQILGKIFDSTLRDPNVNSLLIAAFELERLAVEGKIPGISREDFDRDEVFILADEIIGMAIAEYIGGTRAKFEFVRFDMKKPGVLKKLEAFADDAIGGLIAGASSLMYSEATDKI